MFADKPKFRPNLTPKEVLQRGSFGGGYFRPIQSGVLGKRLAGDWRELPKDWLDGMDAKTMLSSSAYRPEVNKFGVKCGQSLEQWEGSGWIVPQDPRGWFQWYCRFFQGRRTEDDDRQISRWFGIAGPKGRWKRTLIRKCIQAGREHDDANVSPVIRQTLQHWAYELTKPHYDEYARELRRRGD